MNSLPLISLLEVKSTLLFGLEEYYSWPNSGMLMQANAVYIRSNKDITKNEGGITTCGLQ